VRIAVVTNQVPLVRGGAELLVEALARELEQRGHQAATIRIPFTWQPPREVLRHMLAARLIRIVGADRVVALKFPAYYVEHDSKVLWLLHQFRQAYDLWGTPFADLPDSTEGRTIRRAVQAADDALLPEAEHVYTNNRVVSDRLLRFNGLESEVLYPPLADAGGYRCDGYGDFVFYPSRLSEGKRQRLLVEAMRHVRSPVRLVLAGAPDLEEHRSTLERLIGEHELGQRVELIGSWISEERKRELFANALACAYVPYDEDSYGYVTLEAYESRKPVVTCSDSGGALELVEDEQTGLVADPEPEALAAAFDRLYEDRELARSLGEAGHENMRRLQISWDHVVERLTA
jgi:glycosyltransferase involved in cell wall biosynthesis